MGIRLYDSARVRLREFEESHQIRDDQANAASMLPIITMTSTVALKAVASHCILGLIYTKPARVGNSYTVCSLQFSRALLGL